MNGYKKSGLFCKTLKGLLAHINLCLLWSFVIWTWLVSVIMAWETPSPAPCLILTAHPSVMVMRVPSLGSEQAARPNSPSCCQMNIFSMLLVTSPSTDTFLLEVIISSRASIFRSERDWLWPRKCLLCMAAAVGSVYIALQSPPFILGAESRNFVVFSIFQFVNITAFPIFTWKRRGRHLDYWTVAQCWGSSSDLLCNLTKNFSVF